MEAFRTKFFEAFSLDTVFSLTVNSAACRAMQFATKAPFELIAKANGGWELMQDVNVNMRGGLCCAFQPHDAANNPECDGYDDAKPTTCIMDEDATSLYPFAMTKALPVKGPLARILWRRRRSSLGTTVTRTSFGT